MGDTKPIANEISSNIEDIAEKINNENILKLIEIKDTNVEDVITDDKVVNKEGAVENSASNYETFPTFKSITIIPILKNQTYASNKNNISVEDKNNIVHSTQNQNLINASTYDFTDKYIFCPGCDNPYLNRNFIALGNTTRNLNDDYICHNHTNEIVNYNNLTENQVLSFNDVFSLIHISYSGINSLEKIVDPTINLRQIEGTYLYVYADKDYEDRYLQCTDCGGFIYLGLHNNQLKEDAKCPEFKTLAIIDNNMGISSNSPHWTPSPADKNAVHTYVKMDQMTYDYLYNVTVNKDTPILTYDELINQYGSHYGIEPEVNGNSTE